MAQPPNVFITWSKERSKAAAIALRGWIPLVIQAVKPWMSEKDIDKGTVWLSELAKALAGIKLGIICLTPESVSEPWVLFETGVIFKGLDESRVWTYLLGGLRPSDVPQPLGLFQHTVATEADTFRLLQSINEAMDDRGVSSEILKKQFETYWPDLNKELSSLPVPKVPIPKPRSTDEMLAELLELARTEDRQKISIRPTAVQAAIEREEAIKELKNELTEPEQKWYLEQIERGGLTAQDIKAMKGKLRKYIERYGPEQIIKDLALKKKK